MDDLQAAVSQVLRGDTAAFRRIVDATSRQLVRLSARILGNPEEAEDVVQEAYVRAYRSLTEGSFEQRSSVRTWLYRIVTNAAIDARRSRARLAARTAADSANKPPMSGHTSVEARLALSELSAWLEELPEDQRLAILLTAVEGLRAHEAAEILGCSAGAVEQRVLRARTTLRNMREAS